MSSKFGDYFTLCERSVLRPIGVIGGGLTIPVALVGSIALLLFLLRYINLISSDQNNIKEISMAKTLTARTRVFLNSIFETTWAIGIGSVVGHLSA